MNPPHDSRLLRAARCILMAWVFGLVLALDPFTADPAAPIKHLISAVAAVVLTILLLIATLRGAGMRASRLWFVPLAFLAWHGVSALCGPDPRHALPVLAPWTSYLLIAFVASQILREPAQVSRLFAAVVAAMALASLYGFAQAAGLDPIQWSARDIEEYRGLPATFANPNFAGHALALTIPLALGLAWRAGMWMRLVWLATAALLATHLYLTHMRGGPVALVAALIFLALLALGQRRAADPARTGARILGVAIPAALLALLLALGLALYRPDAPLPIDGSLVLRLNGYNGAARMALDHPITGVGAGRYGVETPAYWTPYESRWFANTGKWNHHAHNDLLETAAETGFPGAALYLALVLTALFAALRATGAADRDRRVHAWVLVAGLTAFAVDGLFGFNLRVPVSEALFFLLWGIAVRDPWTAAPARRSTALLATASAIGVLLFSVNAYRGERAYQWGAGGREYLLHALQAGADAERFAGTFDALDAGLRDAARRMPWDARPDTLRAQILLLRGAHAAAEAAYADALARAPQDPGLRSWRARAAMQNAEAAQGAAAWILLNRAEFNALRALDTCATLARAHHVLGDIAVLRARDAAAPEGHRRVAMRRYQRALQYGVESRGTVQLALARLGLASGDAAMAGQYLAQAVESMPENPQVWTQFEGYATTTGNWQGYAEAMHRALGRNDLPLGNMLDLSLRLGQVYTGPLRQPELAWTILGAALARAPYRMDLWAVPVAAAGEDDWHAALTALAAQAGPRNDRWPEDVVYLLDAPPQPDGEVLLRLGRLYITAGAWARADAALDAAAQQLPMDRRVPALRLRSDALAQRGQHAAALALAQEAFQREPNNVLNTLSYARRLAESGKLASADFQYASLREQVSPDTDLFAEIVEEHAAVRAQRDAAQ